jgi:hypothetical protein
MTSYAMVYKAMNPVTLPHMYELSPTSLKLERLFSEYPS